MPPTLPMKCWPLSAMTTPYAAYFSASRSGGGPRFGPGCPNKFGVSPHPGLHRAHEALHRVEQVVEVAVAVEIDLERVETGVAITHQVRRNLFRRTMPDRSFFGRQLIAGDGAELDAE